MNKPMKPASIEDSLAFERCKTIECTLFVTDAAWIQLAPGRGTKNPPYLGDTFVPGISPEDTMSDQANEINEVAPSSLKHIVGQASVIAQVCGRPRSCLGRHEEDG